MDVKQIQKHVNNFQFAGRSVLGNEECGVIAMSEIKSKIYYNKPIIVGCCVLDLSKELMYRKFYERLQPAFGQENIKLCMMDTDSFLLSIECEGGMDEYLEKLERLKDLINDDGILGEFKDELSGKIITEIIAIRAKNYFILTEEDEKVIKAKGAPKNNVKKWTLENYKNAIIKNEVKRETFNSIRTVNHINYTHQTVNKKGMSGFDDKGFMTSQTEQRCHGHYLNQLCVAH